LSAAVLDRPRRRQASARTRRARRRAREGKAMAMFEYDARVLNFLIETRWLAESDAGDKAKIGEAVTRMVADAAEARAL
jgi:hypothetical protein